jgi:drug/metabolite transporter (DMT)-like permease
MATRGQETYSAEDERIGRSIVTPSRRKIILAFASIYLIWGSTYLSIRIAIETLPPFLMAGTRFLIAGVVLYVGSRGRGAEPPTRVHWRSTVIVGALLFLGGNGALVMGEERVPSGLAALLLSIIPLWMVLLGSTEHKGVKLGPRVFTGLLLGLVGIALLVGPSELLGHGRVDPTGAAILLVGSLSWAGGSLYSRRSSLPKSTLLAASMEMLAGGSLLIVAGLALGEVRGLDMGNVSLRSALGLVYLITFGSLLGFTSYNWLLTHSTPAQVSTYAYVNPVVAVFLGWIIAREPVTLRTALATAVIVSAVALIITHRARPVAGEEARVAEAEEAPTVVPCD